MVFPSIPAYLDPSNWQQQQQPQPNHHHHHHQHLHQQQQEHGHGVGEGVSSQLLPRAPPPPPPLPPQPHGSSGAGVGSIRPGSMADRARMANIPMPETQLKCPRCESSNTKFCYFNNYSLTQPRHFCKTCRRYWTRGGALRSVPVGGGCRRNKRSKGSGGGGSSNKSPATSSDRQTASGASSSTLSSNSGPTTSDMLLGLGPQIPPLRFMAPLHHFNEFASSDHLGLNYPGLSCGPIGGPGSDLSFQIGTALAGLGGGGGGGSSIFGGGGLDQWRNIQQGGGGGHQFPFLGGLDSTSSGLYPFENGAEPSGYALGGAGHHNLVRPKMLITTSSIATQLASVKMEESNQERMNLSRQLLGITANNPATGNESSTPQYWSGPAWSTDLSSFSSSSTSNQM